MKLHAEIIEQQELTAREAQVLKLLAEGQPDKRISSMLGIAIKTVATHIDHVYDKLQVKNRSVNARCAAISTAVAKGIIKIRFLSWLLPLGLTLWQPVDDELLRPRIRRRPVEIRRSVR